jgi:hypothetical protein
VTSLISLTLACFCFSEVRLDDHEHDPDPVPEVNNALDRGSYPQSARHEKISELFLNPGICLIKIPRNDIVQILHE